MIERLDNENADLDLTTEVTVLTHTPDAGNPRLCQAVVLLGDGTKDLDASGGNFTLRINLGNQYGEAKTIVLPTQARACMISDWFSVPSDTAVTVQVFSPNAADTDVDVTADLYAYPLTVSLTSAYDAAKTAAQAGDAMTLTSAYDMLKSVPRLYCQGTNIVIGFDAGSTLYIRVREPDGDVWRTVLDAFETWTDGNVALYDIAATFKGGEIYVATFPATLTTAGWYVVTAHIQTGGLPAIADPIIAAAMVHWDGSAIDEVAYGDQITDAESNIIDAINASLDLSAQSQFEIETKTLDGRPL